MMDLLLHIFVLVLLNVPISWKKVHGGVEAEWIGYWIDMARFELGISEKRAQWATRWLGDKATEGRLGKLREGLGCLQFITGAVEFLRPFLCPLYAWAAAGPKIARPKLPVMVVLSSGLASVKAMPCQWYSGRLSGRKKVACRHATCTTPQMTVSASAKLHHVKRWTFVFFIFHLF